MQITEKTNNRKIGSSNTYNSKNKSEAEVKRHRPEGAEKPISALSTKSKHQEEHDPESGLEVGKSRKVVKTIAMATTNKTRRKKGETLTKDK